MLGSTFFPRKTSLRHSSFSYFSPGVDLRFGLSQLPRPQPLSVLHIQLKQSHQKIHYEILCVHQNASQSELKAAYRSLAKLYHPDTTSSDRNGQDFIDIHNAYAILSDPAARASYDCSSILSIQTFYFKHFSGTSNNEEVGLINVGRQPS
ncbi:hypothetical protein NC652_035727 [Populus alba x Populus x berolinensis]|nr:hypothetical protein NC652_035727 [Populus alba x Populus x berolinensis]